MTSRSVTPVDTERLVASITELVNINSGTTNIAGVTHVQRRLAEMLARVGPARISDPLTIGSIDDLGLEATTTYGPQLELNLRPELERRLLIVGHSDTVFTPSSSFQHAERQGDRLHGPGTADMKGGLVLVIEALTQLGASGDADSLGIDLLVTGDEETGSLASAERIEELARRATVGLALEPPMADGAFARARAGSANITVIVGGTSAHAGRALADGRNAVVAASRLAIVASGLGVNVASMQGGGPLNSVPDRCVLRLNKRGVTPAEVDSTLASLRSTATELAKELEVSFEFHGQQHRPAKPWTPEHQRLADLVAVAAGAVGRDARFVDTFGVCDGNNMAAAGCAVVDTLGIGGANIHTPEEFADVGDLQTDVAFLVDVVTRIATDWNT